MKSPEVSSVETSSAVAFLPYLKMYEISGQDPITIHSFDRYLKDKEQDASIQEQIRNSPGILFKKRIEALPEEERASLIEEGLENSNIEIQKASAEMIWSAKREERSFLIVRGLENPNFEVQKASIGMIWYAPEGEITSLIKKCLESPNFEIQKLSMIMIQYVPEEEIPFLIRQCLMGPNFKVQEISITKVKYVSENERTSLLREGLLHPNLKVKKASAGMIWSVPEREKEALREIVLENIKQSFGNPNDPEAQRISMAMIPHAPLKEIASLQNMVLKIIERGLENPDPEVQRAYTRMIKYVSEKEIGYLVQRGLENPNFEVQKVALEMIGYVPSKERQSILNLIIKNGLGNELIKPPLYNNKDINSQNFSRQNFEKTGSETVLLGGRLKDKIIIRSISPEAFIAWQRLFEDAELWKNNGFDYVPVEPILSYKLNKNGLVDVYSGVLDLSLGNWKYKGMEMFDNETLIQKNKILKVLRDLKIEHGHPHVENFCFRFFRDENGQPDFNRPPRLYLIDFDQAVSPEK